MDLHQRPCPIASHPLNTQKYIVPTPSIDALYAAIRKCIKQRVPGGIVYAMTRYGKTYAIRYIRGMLKIDYPGIVTFNFGCLKKKQPSEGAFFSNLLKWAGHPKHETGTNKQLRSRLMHMLMDQLARSPHNFLVLFADEAQKLQIEDYEWLREIHDELEDRGFRMITFLVGQPQLRQQKTALKIARETQIVGRFMIDEFEFRGVTCVEDAATCLRSYDAGVFPVGTEWTFTRFFLPRAWQAGFRLQSCAPQIWAEFAAVHEEAGFQEKLEVPMTYFARSIEIFLTTMGTDLDCAEFRPTADTWKSVVLESRFAQSEEELLTIITEADELELR